jgi:hypothetical protein
MNETFIKRPDEYDPACWVDENRFAEGDKTGYKQLQS